ncbi:golgin subfamily A member 6-like protein 25 [Saccostrea echinata]|uniref:golgin subfamily A member 6-like protein 25 n=1 Tax=Saccostrea echinata TaxID=191078 RepID=UPI002A82AA5D|nr:golgin subfamily A member 6-like protein 25 [Saccostrea echinata]
MDERMLWKNWQYLKNEIYVEDFIDAMMEAGIFTAQNKRDIMMAQPSTRQMKAEKFLNVMIQTGERGYEMFTTVLHDMRSDNRYTSLMEKLNLPSNNVMVVHPLVDDASAASGDHRPDTRGSQRPSTASSGSTDISRDGETGEKNRRSARQAWRSQTSGSTPNSASSRRPTSNNGARGMVRQPSTGEMNSVTRFPGQPQTAQTSNMAGDQPPSAASSDDRRLNEKSLSVDMNILEQELVRIAPTIAELFQKISKTTSSNIPVSEEEIRKVKDENERLRKTNRALIEKLNNFQQKIIQLQLENKNLRENGEGAKEAKEELIRKARELQDMERRLEEQKNALEEKEMELNIQLMKIKEIEKDIVRQKRQITKLEILHEEGQQENERQQEEIAMLKDDRLKQQEQIRQLELKQRQGDERLRRLEERLKQIEEAPVNKNKGIKTRDPKFRTTKRLLGQMYNSEIT